MSSPTLQSPTRTTHTVAGCVISCAAAGQGPPLLVLHHEIGSPGWLPFYDRLAASHNVLVPDLPGYGDSSRPEWARHPRDLAAMLHLFLDELQLGRVAILGLGFGAWIAAEMATSGQGRFSHLVLVNPYGLKPREGEIVDQFVISHEDFVRSGFADSAAFEAVFGAVPSVEQLETWDIHREMTTRIAWRPYMFNPALDFLLGSLSLPTLVASSTGDQVLPEDCAHRYAEAISSARSWSLEGAGHFVDMERPDELARIVTNFVAEEA